MKVKNKNKKIKFSDMKIGVVSRKGQIVIPKGVRDIVGIHPGDAVMFNVEGGKIIVERLGATGGQSQKHFESGETFEGGQPIISAEDEREACVVS